MALTRGFQRSEPMLPPTWYDKGETNKVSEYASQKCHEADRVGQIKITSGKMPVTTQTFSADAFRIAPSLPGLEMTKVSRPDRTIAVSSLSLLNSEATVAKFF